MNVWYLVRQRIKRAARVILNDLFGEDTSGDSDPIVPGSPPGAAILGPIQTYLDALVPGVARLEARQRQAEDERALLLAELNALDTAVDQALLQREDDRARILAIQKLEKSRQYEDLSRHCAEQARIARDARSVMERMQKRSGVLHRQIADLTHREQDARTLEELAALRREIDRMLASLKEKSSRRDSGQ